MAEEQRRRVVHPVLKFLREASPKSVSPGGKTEAGIVKGRLKRQRKELSESFLKLGKSDIKFRAGRSQLVVKMFEDSNASSWTPSDIFSKKDGCEVVFPSHDGYIVEAEDGAFSRLAKKVKETDRVKDKVDISRIESVHLFSAEYALKGREVDEVWPDDDAKDKVFHFWLLPYRSFEARSSIVADFKRFFNEGVVSFGSEKYRSPFNRGETDESWLGRVLNEYQERGIASLSLQVANKGAFQKIVSSGAVFRIDSSSPVSTNKTVPGEGEEPSPHLVDTEGLPSVVVVDGGHSSKSYEGWKAMDVPPLVPSHEADLRHGNQVASIVCHGHAWNNNLNLPKVDCKFIPAQAITKSNVWPQPTTHQILNYLRDLAEESKGYSSVWNLSFNEELPTVDNDEVSYLGDGISRIARDFDILPVVSIGNVSTKNKKRLCPPADCEAAITVSGREAAQEGIPDNPCIYSLQGPGPSGMRKPDLSWFSYLRVIGGGYENGTSYSAPLVASLAAHTFKKIKDPSPDLVKALLINRSEIESHDPSLGWGTPWEEGDYPWLCAKDSVTLAWQSKLKPGFDYYWDDILLPEEMFDGDKVTGEAVLTAILKPKTSGVLGRHYFVTRLQTSLRARNLSGNKVYLIKPSSQASLSKKEKNDIKWNPVRHHRSKLSGRIRRGSVSLYARVYSRDLYQFEMKDHHELGEQDVAFVLTFKKDGTDNSLYNSTIRDLGSDVEHAIDVSQEIDVSTQQ